MDFRDLIASLNTPIIQPEGIIIISLLITLFLDLLSQKPISWLPWIPVGGLILSLGSLGIRFNEVTSINQDFFNNQTIAFLGSFQGDAISIIFRFFMSLSGILCILLSLEYIEKTRTALIEFLILFVTATLGAMFLVGTNDLVTLFVALETLGLSSYLLTGYMKRDMRSNEAALKYLLIGALSSSFLLYGISWLYALSGGHLELNYILANFIATDFNSSLYLPLILITVGIAFKLSAAPFHQWTPDVYQGSPTPIVAFLSVGSKAAGLALATRVLAIIFPYLNLQVHILFEILAVLSMILGNLIAITQTSLKRMLGYSSVGQAGFLMIGLITGFQDGYSSMLLYLFIYILMNLGAFACVILFGLRTGTDQIKDYSGLYKKDPLLAICLTVCLLSLGGIPPLAGFFGKLYLFWAGWQSGFYLLVFVGLTVSVISIYYYLRVIKLMFIKEYQAMSLCIQNYGVNTVTQEDFSQATLTGKNTFSLTLIQPIELCISLCVFGSIFVGLASSPLIELIQKAIFYTPYIQAPISLSTNF